MIHTAEMVDVLIEIEKSLNFIVVALYTIAAIHIFKK